MTCTGIQRRGEGTPAPQERLLQWWMSTRTGKHRRRRPAMPMLRVHAGCLQWGHGSRRKAQGGTPHVHTTRTPLSSTQQPTWYQATPLRTHDTSHRCVHPFSTQCVPQGTGDPWQLAWLTRTCASGGYGEQNDCSTNPCACKVCRAVLKAHVRLLFPMSSL